MTKEPASNCDFPGTYPRDLEAHRFRRAETSHYGLSLSLVKTDQRLTPQVPNLQHCPCWYLAGNTQPP
ncbi:hypothetical protein ILYODFUR_020291 [Ilyodon furcidens]|uniref:Uncharacterized protein n=1 Tax=Ilyodon furcidens TaxID=33524 RepID=A0ABV0VFJ8_9TELE